MAHLPLQADPEFVTTVGETFVDGSAVDLVTSASSGRLLLLFHKTGKKKIAWQIEHSNYVYQPVSLDEATARAMRFPHDAKGFGSIRKILCRIRKLFERYAGLPQPEAALMSAWAVSSWFADCMSSPPTLLISGLDTGHAIKLFRLFHCVCRRPVLLGDLSRSALLALAPLGATLLVNQAEISPKLRALWEASNYRGVHLFGSGTVRSVAGSRAVFLGMADAWGDDGVHLALPSAHCELPSLKDQEQSEIADEIQPQLLMHRLRNFEAVRNFSAPDRDSTFPSTEVARNLAACVLGETETIESFAPLLRSRDQEMIARRGCDVHLAMVEVAWSHSHEDREIGISRLADLTNVLLRSRGEVLEYSPAEIGWKLRNLGFRHHRNGHGMVLQFSRENRFLIHQLVTRWSLNLRSVADCTLCSSGKAVAAKGVM